MSYVFKKITLTVMWGSAGKGATEIGTPGKALLQQSKGDILELRLGFPYCS